MADRNDHEGLWLDDDAQRTSVRSGRGRRVWIVLACVACVGALSVPAVFALTSSPHRLSPQATKHDATGVPTHLGNGQAERQVLSALSATTSSGSFNVTYEFDPLTPPTTPTTTTTTPPTCEVVPNTVIGGTVNPSTGNVVSPPSVVQCSASSTSSSIGGVSITGQGTIDTDPFAMVAVSNVGGLGKITLRDNGTTVWEIGGGDYGLAPGSTDDGPGASLSGFAGLVEGTLGQRQGALAMGGISSPTGYLDLDQSMITGADQTGTGTVDGIPVTVYQVSIDPAQEADVPGINAEQAKAISAAAAILQAQGYTGTTVQVSVDASGYIRQTVSVAHFADGSTSTSEATFSDFGCAGTVLMPGQTGATAPPAGCVSPDTGVAPTTTTTTTTAPPVTTVPPATPSPNSAPATPSLPTTTVPPVTTTSSTTTITTTTTTTSGVPPG